jgi:hypothetical protein
MGLWNRIFGGSTEEPERARPWAAGNAPRTGAGSDDDRAIERYRYLLRTAPPEAIEQAHAEAFATLSAEQRARVLKDLSEELPAAQRDAQNRSDPASLARLATRAELQGPGTLERRFGRTDMGSGMFGGGLLSSIAGAFIGTAIAHQLMESFGGDAAADETASADDAAAADSAGEADAELGDGGGDFGGDDFGGGFEG